MIQLFLKKYNVVFVEKKKAGILGRMPLYSTLPSFKEDKKASKLRIVFDASVKEKTDLA